jgi:hypothetical protein
MIFYIKRDEKKGVIHEEEKQQTPVKYIDTQKSFTVSHLIGSAGQTFTD